MKVPDPPTTPDRPPKSEYWNCDNSKTKQDKYKVFGTKLIVTTQFSSNMQYMKFDEICYTWIFIYIFKFINII